MTDWRLPENRRDAFQRFYSFHLRYKSHPGCVYSLLPAIADHHQLGLDERAWLVWLNGNTQNPAMSLLLLEASRGSAWGWRDAVSFWNDNFKAMDWDTDRRHQKGKFGEATAKLMETWSGASGWLEAAAQGWDATWRYATSQPFMGRLSAWSMTEYARILFGARIPDAATLLLDDEKGSRSHRNGLGLIAGYDSTYWPAEAASVLGITAELAQLGESLLAEAIGRTELDPDTPSRLTLESALCTYKSWHKPDRRYPNVYADMTAERLFRAQDRFGYRFGVLWDARERDLPEYLRVELCPNDPPTKYKQNLYRETGQLPLLEDGARGWT